MRECSRTSKESMWGLGWLASTGRPDMAATHSIIPSGYDRKSPQLFSEVNAAVKQCHAVPITITIWPLPFVKLRWTTFTDSSFDTGERQRHQQGCLVCADRSSIPSKNLYWRDVRWRPKIWARTISARLSVFMKQIRQTKRSVDICKKTLEVQEEYGYRRPYRERLCLMKRHRLCVKLSACQG